MAFHLFLLLFALQEAPRPVAYRCLDDTTFTLIASPTEAIVRFSDGEYRLPRKPSALAVKYATRTATLYLDGDFAAFVADDRPLPGCFKAAPNERG
jgi:hypothetical protein